MGIGSKLKRAYRKITHNKVYDRSKIRRALGLSSKSKWIRQLKRGIKGSSNATSASDISLGNVYQYSPRSIASLMR